MTQDNQTILVLQHAPCETLGTIEGLLIAAQRKVHYVRSYAGESIPDSVGSAPALVVMGGPMGVYEQDRFPFLTRELHLIERTLAAGVPVLGICLGSQLLVTALGGQVRNGLRKEIGWHRVFLESAASDDPLFRDAPPSFETFHWHGDVYDLPPGATRLAHSDLTQCQAYRFGENVYGILFHMEVTHSTVSGMVETFAGELLEQHIDAGDLMKQTEHGLPGSQNVGSGVFGNWVQMLGGRE